MNDFEIQDGVLIKYRGKGSAIINPKHMISICIPDNITKIGASAFSCCNGLISVTIPNTVTSIGDNAFYGCRNLESIALPESVISIGDTAFDGCKNLKRIKLPDHLKTIGLHPFSDHISLESYPDGFIIMNKVLIQYIGKEKSVEIPEGVTHIGDRALDSDKGIEHLILPDSVQTVSTRAVYYRETLKSLTYHHIRMILNKDIHWMEDSYMSLTEAFSLINHIHQFLQNPRRQKYLNSIQENLPRLIMCLDQETFRKIVYTGKIINHQNIDNHIRYAIDHQIYEKQIILTNFKAESIGYDSIKDSIQKKFEL